MQKDLKLKLFRGLADSSRLRVLEGLSDRTQCVSDLMKSTGLTQSNLSMHLSCLRDCGLVRARRNGRFVYYELADPVVVQLLQAADRLLARVSKRIEACPRYELEGNTNVKRAKAKQ